MHCKSQMRTLRKALQLKRRLTVQWFNVIDVDRNGQLDAKELQRALAIGNLHFSLKV